MSINKKQKINKSPGYDPTSVHVSLEKNFSTEKIKKTISRYVDADCWSVYMRNITTKIYFDTRKIANDYPNFSFHDKNNQVYVNEHKVRTNIVNNPDIILNEMKNDDILCIVLGQSSFIDVYCTKNKDNTYNILEIRYP